MLTQKGFICLKINAPWRDRKVLPRVLVQSMEQKGVKDLLS